ncbi:MAG: hypothetical protein QW702_07150 [Candidatus Bathyarchaeia archaeon]
MRKEEQFIRFLNETIREQREKMIREALETIEKYKDLPHKLEKERKKKRRKPLSEKTREKLFLLEFKVSILNHAKRIVENPEFAKTLTPEVEKIDLKPSDEDNERIEA